MARITSSICVVLAGAVALGLSVPSSSKADTQYVYDAAGRLVKVTYSNGVMIQYRYDASGNRQVVTTDNIPNRAPRARPDTASVTASGAVDILVLDNDTDPDRDPLSITAVTTPTAGSATILQSPWRVRYVAPAIPSTQTFTYTISDGQGHTSNASVSILVAGGNQPPVANNDTYSVATLGTLSLWVLSNDTDPEQNQLTVTSLTTPTAGTATIGTGGGYIVYTAPNNIGLSSFSYTVSDGHGGTDTANVSISIYSLETPEPCVPPPGKLVCIDE